MQAAEKLAISWYIYCTVRVDEGGKKDNASTGMQNNVKPIMETLGGGGVGSYIKPSDKMLEMPVRILMPYEKVLWSISSLINYRFLISHAPYIV